MISYWLHGWATDSRVFGAVIGQLEEPYRSSARCLDLPGFGKARPLAQGESYASRIKVEMEADFPRGKGVVLAGWSLGSLVALEAASQLGDTLRGLVLISACARFVGAADYSFGQDRRRLDLMTRKLKKDPSAVFGDFFRGMFPDGTEGAGLWEEFRKTFWPVYGSQHSAPLAEGLEYLAAADHRRLAGKIEVPVLLVHGGQDSVIDIRCARELAVSLPRARLEVLGGAGHMVFSGRESGTAALVSAFFRECFLPVKTPGRDGSTQRGTADDQT